MKQRTQIDLLPLWARNAKARKALIKILAVAQIAIIFLLVLFVFLLNTWERQVWNYSRELSERLASFDSAPAEIAEELQVARTQLGYINEALTDMLPAIFTGEWLDFILESIPEGATLSRIDYNMQELTVSGMAADINIIEQHRANMLEFFTYAQQGHVTLVDYGLYNYEIRAFVGEEEY